MIQNFWEALYAGLDSGLWFQPDSDVAYLAYWLITFAVLGSCSGAGGWLIGRLIARLPTGRTRIWRRETTAARAATTLFPRSATPRSDLLALGSDRLQSNQAVRQGRRLQTPIPWRTLVFRAKIDCWRTRVLYLIMDTLGLMCRGTGAVVALAVVFWVRPSAELEEFLRQSWSSAVQGLLGSASVTRLWPIALFGITILVVVIRQSAVIDNIRARDEAAKDANRLLAELCGALLRTEYQLLLWSRWLKWQTESPLIQVRVERFTDGAYSWTEGRLQPSEDAPRDATGPEAELDRYQTELAATLDDVTEVCRKITASGLTTVCLRMTNPLRYASEEALGLFNPYRFPNPMASPGAGPATIRDRLDRTVSGWPCRHFDPADRNYDAVDEGSLNSAEREAFKFRAELYEMAYELAVTICWCHLVARRLNRRIYGTLLPRFAGAVTK